MRVAAPRDVSAYPLRGGISAASGGRRPQIPILQTLKSRREFLRVRGGDRVSTAAFLMEMRRRDGPDLNVSGARFGLTITKKLGNAVTRNRIRRRLKAALAAHAGNLARPDGDYVVVARAAAVDRQFSVLLTDVERALARLGDTASGGQSANQPSRRRQHPRVRERKP